MPFLSTKCYDHNLGLSACFRQWRANSHCSKIHGYALAFKIIFECTDLDDRNWCVDFGGLKPVKQWLENTFDHKLLVAEDDPQRELLEELGEDGVADVVIVKAVGCEMFARMVFDFVQTFVVESGMGDRVHVHSVECREHSGNSAIYAREDDDMDFEDVFGTPDMADNIIDGDLTSEEQEGDDLDEPEGGDGDEGKDQEGPGHHPV